MAGNRVRVFYTDEHGVECEAPIVDGTCHMPLHGGPLNFRMEICGPDGVWRPSEGVGGGGGGGSAQAAPTITIGEEE